MSPSFERTNDMTGSRAEKRPNISKVFQERRLALGQRYELARTALLNVLQDEEVEPGADFIAVASERSGLAEDDVHYTFLSIKRKGGESTARITIVYSTPQPFGA